MREARGSWPTANRPDTLEDGGVHLWFAELSGSADGMYDILSAEERQRAARFSAPLDGDRFVLARGLLRTLLGAYQNCPPESLRFAYNDYGKPFLPGAESLEFNLSHCEDVLLLGVARGRRIGVDIERVDSGIDCGRLAKRFLSTAEYAQWDSLPLLEKNDAWFRYWTRKEASLKAVGVGLTPLLSRSSESDIPGAAQWRIQTVIPCAGFVGALAVEGGGPAAVSYHCWSTA